MFTLKTVKFGVKHGNNRLFKGTGDEFYNVAKKYLDYYGHNITVMVVFVPRKENNLILKWSEKHGESVVFARFWLRQK